MRSKFFYMFQRGFFLILIQAAAFVCVFMKMWFCGLGISTELQKLDKNIK